MDSLAHLPASVIFLTALALCLALLKIAVVAGKQAGLVDRPTERKNHVGDIPLVGGASIFLTLIAMQLVSPLPFAVLFAGGLLVMIGIADDYLDLSARVRLVVQALAAVILVWGGGYLISSLGELSYFEGLLLSGAGAGLFSVLCIVGVVNAINMIDGADGLAGGVVAISVGALLTITLLAGAGPETTTGLVVTLGAVLAFLLFNSGAFGRGQKVFLGDSGSMFLGILLASYYIGLSQGDEPYLSPVAAGWLFGLPLMDSVSVMAGRLIKGKSPLQAGRDHLHHRLMRKGLSSGVCVALMLSMHAVLVIIGVIGNNLGLSSQVMFWGFVSLVIAYHFISPLLLSPYRTGLFNQKRRASN